MAEFFLRLGVVLVAWLTVLAHLLWLAVLRVVDCDAGGVQPWLLTLIAAPVVAALAATLPSGRRLPGIASLVRLPSLLLIPLLPLAALTVVELLWSVNVQAHDLCGIAGVTWQTWWAPTQLAVLVLIGVVGIKSW